MLIASSTVVAATRHPNKLATGAQTWLTHYMGKHVLKGREAHVAEDADSPEHLSATDSTHPMAHLVEQEANSTIPPHYHRPAQFQVFVAGEGHLGRHSVCPVTAHFAAPFTPYGPIRAGDSGVSYFTLRSGWDPGARWMPQSRPNLEAQRARIGHALFAERVSLASTSELHALDRIQALPLLAAPHGLFVSLYRVPAARRWQSPDPGQGAGQFQVVLAGSGTLRDASATTTAIGALSCVFLDPHDASNTIDAGESGMEVLVLQFPKDPYYVTRPHGNRHAAGSAT